MAGGLIPAALISPAVRRPTTSRSADLETALTRPSSALLSLIPFPVAPRLGFGGAHALSPPSDTKHPRLRPSPDPTPPSPFAQLHSPSRPDSSANHRPRPLPDPRQPSSPHSDLTPPPPLCLLRLLSVHGNVSTLPPLIIAFGLHGSASRLFLFGSCIAGAG